MLASDFVCFVDNQRVTGEGRDQIAAGHAISMQESYLGLQDELRKLRAMGGSRRPGVWAKVCVFNKEDLGVVTLTSQDKWECLQLYCCHWLDTLESGKTMLEFKRLQSDQGFMVYVTQSYPLLKPYLKGFHLSLETWQGGRNPEGWKERECQILLQELNDQADPLTSYEVKLQQLIGDSPGAFPDQQGPSSGFTQAVSRFWRDLKALLFLTQSKKPILRRVRTSQDQI